MTLRYEIRRGAYADSIVLMQLQSALASLDGIEDAGVVMATTANLDLLTANRLLPEPPPEAGPDDLLIVVRATDEADAEKALGQVDSLMERRGRDDGGEFRPRSLRTAFTALSKAGWVSVSVPGAHAGAVTRQALAAGRHVFLYSDNVALAEEVELKELARERGLLVLGPDCGTAIIGGLGLGFANRVRRGGIGIVAASGTGLQAVTSRIHAMDEGISQALGTGGRDLSHEVGGRTTLQSLNLLARDDETKVIVLLSKPPSATVATRVVAAARASGKPTVIAFSGLTPPIRWLGNLHFAAGLDEAATRAVELLATSGERHEPLAPREGFLRGLFSGGTLALEMLQGMRFFVSPLHANLEVPGVVSLTDSTASEGHTIVDLGADEFTVGRLHPMIDQDLRLRRLRQEADDPEVRVIVLDVVLGDGAHTDPASELVPVLEEIGAREDLEVIVLLVGTDDDPQDLASQRERLTATGARIFDDVKSVIEYVARELEARPQPPAAPVALESLRPPVSVVNVGLESFYYSLRDQGAEAVHVEWRPPARGNERLTSILEKMK